MIGRGRSHPGSFDDDVVLITGATSGIGAGLATRFHARGAHVVVTGRDSVRLSAMAAEHPGMTPIVMDVCDPESVGRAIAEIAASIPHLTTLINNAGVQRPLDFSAQEQPASAEIADEIATNFTGLVNVTSQRCPSCAVLLARGWCTWAPASASFRSPALPCTPRPRQPCIRSPSVFGINCAEPPFRSSNSSRR